MSIVFSILIQRFLRLNLIINHIAGCELVTSLDLKYYKYNKKLGIFN